MTRLVLEIATYGLAGLSVVSLVRVLIGPTPEDRMIALNLVSGQVLAIMVLAAVRHGRSILLDVALVYAILGFVGVLAITRFLEREREP